jgi:cytochrome c oxidase subunit 2
LKWIAVGHQFWWEFRYPALKVVTANELHVPLSDPEHPTPTFITLTSADTDHSFWVPRLAGKTDLIPNRINTMWIDPHEPGVYLGQCAQYCVTQHAKMLLRVYVQTRDDFDRWIQEQNQPAHTDDAVRGAADLRDHRLHQLSYRDRHAGPWTLRPDLTHLMSRDTIASGLCQIPATSGSGLEPRCLETWMQDAGMDLGDQEIKAVAAYLETLR